MEIVVADWIHKKKIYLTGKAGAGVDYQQKLLVGESSGSGGADFHVEGNSTDFPSGKNDGGDLRFTADDGLTLLDFWVEKITGVTPNRVAYIWVEVSADLSSNQSIYIYYNSNGAANYSNGEDTFIIYDNFDDESLNTDIWQWIRDSGGDEGSTSVDELTIPTYGDLYQATTTCPILRTKTAITDLTEGRVHMKFSPVANYHTAGIMLWEDDQNWARLNRQHNSGQQIIKVEAEYSGGYGLIHSAVQSDTDLYVAIRKDGSNFYGLYGSDFNNLTEFATYNESRFGTMYWGLHAIDAGAASINATYDDFFVRKRVEIEPLFSSADSEEAANQVQLDLSLEWQAQKTNQLTNKELGWYAVHREALSKELGWYATISPKFCPNLISLQFVPIIPETGLGDMLKSIYDTNNDGIVDKAETIDDGTYSASAQDVADAVSKKHTQNTDTQLDSGVLEIDGNDNLVLTQNSVAVMTSVDADAVVNTLYLKEGKVGIGTTPLYAELHVAGHIWTQKNGFYIAMRNGDNTYGGNIRIASPGDVCIDTRVHPVTTERMRISGTTGNVGIGTSGAAAGELLDVRGKVKSQVIEDIDSDTDEVISTGILASYGMLIVRESTGGVTGLFRLENQTIVDLGSNAAFTITEDNAGTYNVYWSVDQFKVQNKVGDNKNIRVGFFGV